MEAKKPTAVRRVDVLGAMQIDFHPTIHSYCREEADVILMRRNGITENLIF